MDDYLDRVEAQLVALTEQGAHRRLLRVAPPRPERRGSAGTPPNGRPRGRRFRTELLAFAAGFAVVAAVVGVLLGLQASPPANPANHPLSESHRGQHATKGPKHGTHHHAPRHSRTKSTATPVSPVGAVPVGFVPQSFTATGELIWWLLGSAPCAKPPCTSLVRTTDGGQSFVGIHAPAAALVSPGSGGAGISELRFASPTDGFAYGPQLWSTHDAGASWSRVGVSGAVTDLSIGGGYAYATVVSPSSGVGRLERSPIGSESWVTLPGAGNVNLGLWVHGSDVFAQSGDRVAVSHDGGATFSRFPAPSGLPCDFEEQVAPVVWAHCATGMDSAVWRSTDGGRTFTGQPSNTVGVGIAPQPNSAPFAAASSTTAVVGYQQLYRTNDGGHGYSRVGPRGVMWEYLGFTDSTHGVALGFPAGSSPSHDQLYYTTDSGVTYHPVPIG